MKIQVISDIHLEHMVSYDDDGSEIFEPNLILTPSAPVLIMAGDISTHWCPWLPIFLDYVSTHFELVLWVLGNHEYYTGLANKSMTDIKKKLLQMCPRNVHILDNDVHVWKDIAFVGTTLWSHIPSNYRQHIERNLSDYRRILWDDKTYLSVDHVNSMHDRAKRFLQSSLQSQASGKKIVVITHHSPVMQGTSHPQYEYEGNILRYAFGSMVANELHELEKDRQVVLWVCGHTHHNFNIPLKHYRLLSNQFGYEGEHTGITYRFDHHIEI